MRKTCRLALAITFALLCASTVIAQDAGPPRKFKHGAKFATRYDKFKDQTTVLFYPMAVSGTARYLLSSEMLGLFAAFTYSGKTQPASVSEVIIAFTSTSPDWVYLKDRELIALVDGERLPLGEAARDSSVKYGGVEEMLAVTVSYDHLLKLTNARVVEMKLGDREIKLKEKHLEALRDLASRMKS